MAGREEAAAEKCHGDEEGRKSIVLLWSFESVECSVAKQAYATTLRIACCVAVVWQEKKRNSVCVCVEGVKNQLN